MKFLVDAQLPRSLCHWLQERGHDAVHTLDLALGNRTPDSEIVRIADAEGRIFCPSFELILTLPG